MRMPPRGDLSKKRSEVDNVALLETAVSFLVVFAILVIFHELGHFLAAKAFKMPVEEFAVGFGKKLAVLFRSGGTEYTVRAIPAGGFVRIAGMEFETGNESAPDDDAPADAPEDGFNLRPVYQRYLVILAGPVFSLILGYLAYVVLFLGYGVPSGRPRLDDLTPDKPAIRAGFRSGDVVLSVDGKSVTPLAMIEAIEGAPGKPLTFVVRGTDSAERTVTVIPEAVDEGGKKVGKIGVRPGAEMRAAGPAEAISEAGHATGFYFQMLGKIFASGKAKEAVGGPVGIARTFYQTAGTGLQTKFELLASLSLSLFLFNILPIPILDGGHLMLLTIEGIRRRKLSVDAMHRVHLAGVAVIAMLFLFVMFNDITRWMGLR